MIGKLTSTYKSWKKHSKYLALLPNQLKVVNTGSTPLYNAFDYKLWECKGGNFAYQPQSLYYDIETLKRYSKNLADSAIVLFGIEEFKLCAEYRDIIRDYKYYLWLDANQILTYKRFRRFLILFFPFIAYPQLIWRDIKSFIKVLIRYHVSHMTESSTENDDIRFANYWLKLWTEEFNWNKGYNLSVEQQNNIEVNKKRLSDAIKKCKEENYKPYIVVPPFSPNLIKILPKRLLQECLWKPITEVAKDHQIEIIDCYHEPVFADWSLYANALTLNINGRVLFNHYIQEKLKLNK